MFSIGLSLLDVYLTKVTIKRLNKLEPDRAHNHYEFNWIMKLLWRFMSYDDAMKYQMIISSSLIAVIIVVTYIFTEQLFFFISGFILAGVIFANITHYQNLVVIHREEIEKGVQNGQRTINNSNR